MFLAGGGVAAGTEAGCSSGGYKRRTQQKAGRTATIFTARYPVLYGTFMTFLAPLGILFRVSIRTRIRSGLAVQLSQGQGRQPLAFSGRVLSLLPYQTSPRFGNPSPRAGLAGPRAGFVRSLLVNSQAWEEEAQEGPVSQGALHGCPATPVRRASPLLTTLLRPVPLGPRLGAPEGSVALASPRITRSTLLIRPC